MTQAVAHLLEAAERLSTPERADLVDLLVERYAHDIPPDLEAAHLAEVRRRIAQVESGEVTPIPVEEAIAQMRRLVASADPAS